MKNAVIIGVRMDSERLPSKALAPIAGKPNLARAIERFRQCKNVSIIIVVTTVRHTDDAIADWCAKNAIRCFRGSYDDLLASVFAEAQNVGANYILRATADCPFISWELVDMAFQIVTEHRAEAARIWGVADRGTPIYGAAEFPYSYSALKKLNQFSAGEERTHVGMHLDAHRQQYNVIYPSPPPIYFETFYHPFRLELDTPADLELTEKIITDLGDLPPLHHVVRYLDAHPDIARINGHVAEKTGPMTSFSPQTRAVWKMDQSQNKTVEWRGDWGWLLSGSPAALPKYAKPVFCSVGKCYVGYALRGNDKVHRLHRADGVVLIGRATLPCACGAGREWFDDARK